VGGLYLTILEYRQAPTAVTTSDLVYGSGVQADQDAQLLQEIQRASDGVTSFCSSDLVASTRTMTEEVWINRAGRMAFHPGDGNLTAVTSISLGIAANALTAVSATALAAGWIDTKSNSFILPAGAGTFAAGASPLQVGTTSANRALARYNYVAGYPSTTLAVTAAAAATSVTVASNAGIVAGTVLTIVDGAKTENVTVTATPTTNTVAVTALAQTHTFVAGPAAAIAVHAMPTDLRRAVVYLVSALVQSRGNDSLTMGQLLTPAPAVGVDASSSVNGAMARKILVDGGYVRIR